MKEENIYMRVLIGNGKEIQEAYVNSLADESIKDILKKIIKHLEEKIENADDRKNKDDVKANLEIYLLRNPIKIDLLRSSIIEEYFSKHGATCGEGIYLTKEDLKAAFCKYVDEELE